jgi:hypothetical protein
MLSWASVADVNAGAVAVEKTLPVGAGVNCHEQYQEQSQQQYQQCYHQHQQQAQHAELITKPAEATAEEATTIAEAAPATARKGRKLRRRRKKSTGNLDDLDDSPSTTATVSTTVSSCAGNGSDEEGAPAETTKPLTRAQRRALQNQKQNPNVSVVSVTPTGRSNGSIINMSSCRVNPSKNDGRTCISASYPSNSCCSSNDKNHNTKGKQKKGSTYASESSAVSKELYVAIRCEFVVPEKSNNNHGNNVRRVVLVSWDHQPLWEACLDSVAKDNDNNDSVGARGEWTITEYINNKSTSSSSNSSNHRNSTNNNKNNNSNRSHAIMTNCESIAPSPNLRIWRHQSFQQVRFQLQQQIASRVIIGHGLSRILAAWQLPRHPACNVRDASTFSVYMQEQTDPLSVMVVPRSLEKDLMPHYLNMNMDENTFDTDTNANIDALLQQAVACMMLYQRSRVEWEQDVARWMQQQERQRAIRNERLASLSMSSIHHRQLPPLEQQNMCCESYPTDLSAAADCWSTAGSNYAKDMEVRDVTVPPQPTEMSSSSNFTRNRALASTHPTTTMDDDNDDDDYDYDGALVAAVESFSIASPLKTQDAAVAAAAGGAAASEWNGWSTPFLSSAPIPRTTTTTTSQPKSSKDRTTWGSMLALPPPPRPTKSLHSVSSEDLSAEPNATPRLNYPLTLLEEEDKECGCDFGGGAVAASDDDDDNDNADTGGHLPSCLLNDSSDEEEDHATAIPWREKRNSSHPIDGDDWLDQDNLDHPHQQQQQPKAVSQPYWFRRRQSMSPPCVRTDIGGSSKYDSNSSSNMAKSLISSERQNSRFLRSPPGKPLSSSERGARRNFFSPPGSEICKSSNHIACATTEGENFHPQSETETTTMGLDQSERQHFRSPRSPSKPLVSDRVVRRSFFFPLTSEVCKSTPSSAPVEGRNLRSRSETETTTTLIDELSTF